MSIDAIQIGVILTITGFITMWAVMMINSR